MLKKIAIFLFVLLIIQLFLYNVVLADGTGKPISMKTTIVLPSIEDASLEATINKLGISTRVNEEALEKKYPETKVTINPENGNAMIVFTNTNAKNYRLDIYNVNSGLVASYVNVNTGHVEINRELYEAGAYIYKLMGDDNTYCGTFMLR